MNGVRLKRFCIVLGMVLRPLNSLFDARGWIMDLLAWAVGASVIAAFAPSMPWQLAWLFLLLFLSALSVCYRLQSKLGIQSLRVVIILKQIRPWSRGQRCYLESSFRLRIENGERDRFRITSFRLGVLRHRCFGLWLQAMNFRQQEQALLKVPDMNRIDSIDIEPRASQDSWVKFIHEAPPDMKSGDFGKTMILRLTTVPIGLQEFSQLVPVDWVEAVRHMDPITPLT